MKLYFRTFIDYEKEEQWINTQSLKGLHLKRALPFYYQFDEGEPGKFAYRVVLLPKDREEYLEFLTSTGIEIVCKYYKWAYVRKISEDEPFELYSDHTSKISYYNQIILLYLSLFIFNLICAITNVSILLTFNGESLKDLNGWIGLLNTLVVIFIFAPLIKTFKKRM